MPASVRRHTHTNPLSLFVLYIGVSPCGIRQGYRGCSGVLLVVIGVGPTDHLNTRHCNHDCATSLFLSLCLLRISALSLSTEASSHSFRPDTLFAYRIVIAPSHPRVTRLTVRGIPPDCYHRPTSSLFVSIVASSDLRDDIARIPTVTLASSWIHTSIHDDRHFSVVFCHQISMLPRWSLVLAVLLLSMQTYRLSFSGRWG